MSEYSKLPCTCIEAYKTRKMRDPNCCACSCDYNDVVEENDQLRQQVEQLTQRAKQAERERDEYATSTKKSLKNDIKLLKSSNRKKDFEIERLEILVDALQQGTAKRDTEQQIKALEYAIESVSDKVSASGSVWDYHQAMKDHVEQLRKQGEE